MTLVQAVGDYSPDAWTDRKRRLLGYKPSEVFATIRQEAELFLTPVEHEQALARRLQYIVDDPVLSDNGMMHMVGDSNPASACNAPHADAGGRLASGNALPPC